MYLVHVGRHTMTGGAQETIVIIMIMDVLVTVLRHN